MYVKENKAKQTNKQMETNKTQTSEAGKASRKAYPLTGKMNSGDLRAWKSTFKMLSPC